MKLHHHLYLLGILLILANIAPLIDDTGKTPLVISDGLVGVITLSCGFILGHHTREIERLRSQVDRLRRDLLNKYDKDQPIENNTNDA
jgi:hypothetical protein